MTPSTPAVACSLEAGEFKDRIAWIAALNARHLVRSHRDDLLVVLTYDLAAREKVADLKAREQACCAFLSFSLHETDTGVELKIGVPEEARDATDVLLAPFLGDVSSGALSACCGSCPTAAAL